jgi:thiol-disulfide isomerase/thioredoxin
MGLMVRTVVFSLVVSTLSFAGALEFEAGKSVQLDLEDHFNETVQYSLDRGPRWVQVRDSLLIAAPTLSDLGSYTAHIKAETPGGVKYHALDLDVVTDRPSLIVFTAPWCKNCDAAVSDLDSRLQALGGTSDPFWTQVFLETGSSPYDAPTAKAAKQYAADLNLKMPVKADAWQWKTYQRYFGSTYDLPAAVILTAKGKVLKSFDPKAFDARKIADEFSGGKLGPNTHDILWVVDNSGSMGPHLGALNAATAKVIGAFTAKRELEWKMGIVSTDVKDRGYLGFGTDFDWHSIDPVRTFQAAISALGTMGDTVERPFQTAVQALEKPGFLRSGAKLSIVIVTDAADQSSLTGQDFLDKIIRIKGSLDGVTVSGVFGATDLKCAWNDGIWNYATSSYKVAVDATRGSMRTLCNPGLEKDFESLAAELAAK